MYCPNFTPFGWLVLVVETLLPLLLLTGTAVRLAAWIGIGRPQLAQMPALPRMQGPSVPHDNTLGIDEGGNGRQVVVQQSDQFVDVVVG